MLGRVPLFEELPHVGRREASTPSFQRSTYTPIFRSAEAEVFRLSHDAGQAACRDTVASSAAFRRLPRAGVQKCPCSIFFRESARLASAAYFYLEFIWPTVVLCKHDLVRRLLGLFWRSLIRHTSSQLFGFLRFLAIRAAAVTAFLCLTAFV